MKKLFSAIICATLLCTNLFSMPVSAGWDREYFTLNGASGYVYCSTGVTNYPSGYAAEIEADTYKDLSMDLVYYTTSGARDTRYLEGYDFYMCIEEWGVPVASMSCLFYVNGVGMRYGVSS